MENKSNTKNLILSKNPDYVDYYAHSEYLDTIIIIDDDISNKTAIKFIKNKINHKNQSDNSIYKEHDDYTEHLDTTMENDYFNNKLALEHINDKIKEKNIMINREYNEYSVHADEVIHTDIAG